MPRNLTQASHEKLSAISKKSIRINKTKQPQPIFKIEKPKSLLKSVLANIIQDNEFFDVEPKKLHQNISYSRKHQSQLVPNIGMFFPAMIPSFSSPLDFVPAPADIFSIDTQLAPSIIADEDDFLIKYEKYSESEIQSTSTSNSPINNYSRSQMQPFFTNQTTSTYIISGQQQLQKVNHASHFIMNNNQNNHEPQQLGANQVQIALQKKKLAQYQATQKVPMKPSPDCIGASKPNKIGRKSSGKSDSSGGQIKNKGGSSHSSDREAYTTCTDQNTNIGPAIGKQLDNLSTFKLLGEGLQAKLYAAHSGDADKVECLKIFEPFKDEYQLSNAEVEFKVSQILKGHPNIIQIDSFHRNQSVRVQGVQEKRDFMNLEYCDRGDLYEFIKQYLEMQDQQGAAFKGLLLSDMSLLKHMFLQLIESISALHNKAGYAHMDIKLDNILISNEGNLKLCDFGLSTNSLSLISKKLGTEAYMAPEIHYARSTPCVAKYTDIFSLGILFFIITFGAPPFHTAQPQDTYFKFLKMKPGSVDFFKFHPHTRTLFREGLIDENLQKLLISMLIPDPEQRVQNIEDLKKSDFLKSETLNLQQAGQELIKKYDEIHKGKI